MPKPKDLRVVANPYRLLDEDGDPCCAAHRGDIKNRLICARLDLDRLPKKDADGWHGEGPLKYLFDEDAVETLPSTPMHRRLVSDGAVLPADEATAKACGVKFQPVAEARAATKARASAAFLAMHGEAPAWASAPASSAPKASSKPTPNAAPSA